MTDAPGGSLCPRPSPESVKSTWKDIFSDPLISLSSLKAKGLSKDGLGESDADGGITLRSVYWRFYHGLLPGSTSLESFPAALADSRARYDGLRKRYLVAPDGRWASDCSTPEGPSTSPTSAGPSHSSSTRYKSALVPSPDPNDPLARRGSLKGKYPADASSSSNSFRGQNGVAPPLGLGVVDPLSLDGDSPWKSWFAQLDLRSTIRQDVERTFPDIPYFTDEGVRRGMLTILFLFCMLNPDVGYRQGMHELLAVCYLVVDRDSLVVPPITSSPSPLDTQTAKEISDKAMYATLDRKYVEHDAFELFVSLMKPAKAFYEWRAEEGPRAPVGSPVVAPIIRRCNHIHMNLIRRIDPQLWGRLETEGVEAQIWAIRWLRLIFTRELGFSSALRIWDGVFAEDPSLQILDFIAVAMLLLIRNQLLDADYATLLSNLLHYPSPSALYPFSPFLILTQAAFLRDNTNPSAGVEVVMQNHQILAIKASVLELDGHVPSRPSPGFRQPVQRVQSPRSMQGLAAGLFERAQAAGLDKAIMSTVADLRKNLPDTATAYSYLPHMTFGATSSPRHSSGPFSSIPASSSTSFNRSFPSLPPLASPVPEPRNDRQPIISSSSSSDSFHSAKTIKDAELEIAELRLAMVGMGKAMSEWLAALPAQTPDRAKNGLVRIRDTLLESAGKDTEEIVREWGWHEGLETPSSREQTPGPELEGPDQVAMERTGSNRNREHLRETDRSPIVDQITPRPAQTTFASSSAGPSPYQGSSQIDSSSSALQQVVNEDQVDTRPTLHLSTRNDRPAAGLIRVPMTAPGSRTASRPVSSGTSPMLASSAGPSPSPLLQPAGYAIRGPLELDRGRTDPLAKLGDDASSLPRGHHPSREPVHVVEKPPEPEVDPLAGIGLR